MDLEEKSAVSEVKIPVNQLVLGMYVSRLDKAWIDSPFLFQGFLIENDIQIKKLIEECHYVYVDRAKSLAGVVAKQAILNKPQKAKFSIGKLFSKKEGSQVSSRNNTNKLADVVARRVVAEEIKPPPKSATFDQEMKQAKQVYAETDQLIQEFTSKVKEGSTIDILVAKQTVHNYMASVLRSPDAMLLITRLKKKHQAAWQHSMNVCVLAINLGRYLNLNDNDLITLGLCGLFHDIGKLKIPEELLNSENNYDALVRSHTLLGRDILQHTHGALGEIVAEVAYSHHEKLDGSGLPQGLRGGQISAYTRMITIVDTYDSLTNDRPGRKALTHYKAMTIMLNQAGKQLDETLVNSFNQCIGTYPVGCVVELNTGEVGIVVENNENQKLRPKVMLLTTPDKQLRTREVVNLADTNTENPYTVKGIVLPEKYGLKI